MSSTENTDIFTIRAAPGTDIWRKPPTTNIYNGIAATLTPLIPFPTNIITNHTQHSSPNSRSPLSPFPRSPNLLPLRPRLFLLSLARTLRPSRDPTCVPSSVYLSRPNSKNSRQMDQNGHRILSVPTPTEHGRYRYMG